MAKMWGGHFLKGEPMCTAQGFLMIYGGLSTFYWIMTIAFVMYTMIFHPFMWYKEGTIGKCNKIALVINFTLPFLFAFIPILTNDYAPTGGWCWISGKTTSGKVLRWAAFYGQLVVILVFCVFAYVRIYIHLRFSQRAEKLKATHKMYNRIKWYPLCLILGYSVAMTRRFIELWDVHLGFGWALATSVTTGLFGFFLLMVYGRLGKLNKLFKQKYPCCIPFCDTACGCLEEIAVIQSPKESSKTSKTGRSSTTGKVLEEGMPSPLPSPSPVPPGASGVITPRTSFPSSFPKLQFTDTKMDVLKEAVTRQHNSNQSDRVQSV
eukprot:CAMPEP_0197026380 /NCGR_PEP_ID=MMETSP1384-20130603/6477_1 /TAXON_ID=29189 /ORGANISM="Ammonia sp." /LENGTH=320 /DNA_ID=CAMNT_0042455033 /DNA_START=221 /DNA_END=1183 /DNA_ORIENTATION=-